MHALHVALQEGFVHDDVAVSLDGAQLYHVGDVSTLGQFGLAGSFDTEVTPGPHAIEIRLSRRNARRKIQSLSVTRDTWIGVSLRPDGQFDIHVSAIPFGYL